MNLAYYEGVELPSEKLIIGNLRSVIRHTT